MRCSSLRTASRLLGCRLHAARLIAATLSLLERADWNLAPFVVVEQGRVAVGDEIGECVGAAMCVVLIGERPGLSSADSLGVYLSWNPHPGLTDADRNCISNIRTEGLSYAAAANRLVFLMNESRRRKLSGVGIEGGGEGAGIISGTNADHADHPKRVKWWRLLSLTLDYTDRTERADENSSAARLAILILGLQTVNWIPVYGQAKSERFWVAGRYDGNRILVYFDAVNLRERSRLPPANFAYPVADGFFEPWSFPQVTLASSRKALAQNISLSETSTICS